MFVIDRDNVIRFLLEGESPKADEGVFENYKEFVAISQSRNWSKADVTDVWNGFAGEAGPFADLRPKKQYKSRTVGLEAIWKVIQVLKTPGELIEMPASENPTQEDTVKTKTKGKRPRKTATKAEKKPAKPREHSKRDEVVRLISRANGATQAEIMEKMGWQPHTTRGMISTLGSRYGFKIESTKTEAKGRRYHLIES